MKARSYRDLSARHGSDIAALIISADDLRAVWCNDFYRRLLTGSKEQQNFVGVPFEEFASPSTTAGLVGAMRESHRTGEPLHLTNYVIADVGKGATAWEWWVYPLPDETLLVLGREGRC